MQKAQEENVDIIRISEIREQSHNNDGTFTATIELITAPEFELPEYKNLKYRFQKLRLPTINSKNHLIRYENALQNITMLRIVA